MRAIAGLTFASWLLALPYTVSQEEAVVQFHGSGTSNPDRCYWHVLQTMETQTKIPIRTTYRSTSSGPGQTEFVGNVTVPYTHYASADYPLTQERYNLLTDAGHELIHLPVLMGAIGIFHSVPLKSDLLADKVDMNLTSCLVARIFKQDIVDWNHQDIVDINPSMDIPVQVDAYGNVLEDQSFPIKISHRTLGSSSTFAFTKYLHKSCPEEWGEELVGSQITWPDGPNSLDAQGTSAMLSNIRADTGVIGYADSGLALDQGMPEVALALNQVSMIEAFYLTSENSINKGGILASLGAEGAGIPTSSYADWSGVDLINQVEGYVYTWPMVLMTYIFVRKDLPSFLPDPRAQSLMVEFLKNLYNPLYVNKCEDEFKFVAVTGEIRDVALAGINSLVLSEDAPEWTLESSSVLTEGGQGDYVISTRRKSVATIQQDILREDVVRTDEKLEKVLDEVTNLQAIINALELEYSDDTDQGNARSDDQERRIDASFVLSILAITLSFVLAIVVSLQRAALKEMEAKLAHGKRSSKHSR